MTDDVPLRDYFDTRLADSDKRLEEKQAALEKLRDMDRAYALEQFRRLDDSIAALRDAAATLEARYRQIGAGLLFLVSVVGLIQWWRGSP